MKKFDFIFFLVLLLSVIFGSIYLLNRKDSETEELKELVDSLVQENISLIEAVDKYEEVAIEKEGLRKEADSLRKQLILARRKRYKRVIQKLENPVEKDYRIEELDTIFNEIINYNRK